MSPEGVPADDARGDGPSRYPLHVSPDRRRLLDVDGRPFLVQGDAAWSLIANTTLEEATRYLDARRALGFNTILVSLIEYLFAVDAPRNRYGAEPFSRPGDLGTPNEAYFAHADRVLALAAERGFLVLLAPSYLGYPHPHYPGYQGRAEGWYDEIVAAGVEGGAAWGEYVGRRYGHLENIFWTIGGDRDPEGARDALDAIVHGLKRGGASTLFTAHVHPEHSPIDAYPGADWLDVNLTYTYAIVHRALIADWERRPVWPFLLIESTYEGEHRASAQQIRRQAWWSVLCGGNGHVMGNKPMWLFGEGWPEAMGSPAATAMSHWGAFLRSIAWADLVPDIEDRLAVDGLGEDRGLDRVIAASTADRRLAVAYLPVRRDLVVDLDQLAGDSIEVGWLEPATGRRVAGMAVSGRGRASFSPPFGEDAVLILRAAQA